MRSKDGVNTKGWMGAKKFKKSVQPGLSHTGQIPSLKVKKRAKNKGRKMYSRPAVSANPVV